MVSYEKKHSHFRSSRISFDTSDSDGLGNGDILLEDGSNDGETSFILKEGDETVETTGIEDTFGGTILLELSTLDTINDTGLTDKHLKQLELFVQDDGGKLLINRFHEDSTTAKLLFDGQTQVEQMMVFKLQRKILVIFNIRWNDVSSTDANSKILGEDETGSGDILLDGTDSSSTDL